MFEQKKTTKIIITIILIILGVISLYPFLFMIFSSFKPTSEVMNTPLQPITENFTFNNFITVFTAPDTYFTRWYANTVIMTVITLALKFFLITFTAYGFSKIKFPGRDVIFLVLVSAMMIPSDIMIIPRYFLFNKINLMNTMWAIIFPSVVDVYFVFLLRQSFTSIPDSISEAATIDGCNHFQIYYKMIIPLAKAGIATMLLFSFVWVWNDYMSAYLYINDPLKYMLSVGIKEFASKIGADYGAQMAASSVVLLPAIILFIACQKYFVEGVTAGAVKG